MKLLCTTVFTLAITTASFADIYQYADCDQNGTLLLTELNAEPGVNLSDLYLGCAALTAANLTDAHLDGADLTSTDLTYANLIDADLNGADLTNTYLYDANLSGADLGSAYLTNTDLTYATLTGANLNGAILTGAYLNYANLPGANLTDAILTGVYLSDAILTGANLTGANLTSVSGWQSATWTGATYNDLTYFPSEMNPEKFGMIYDSGIVTGACCVTSGCAVMAEVMCTDLGGTWTEAGSCDDCVAPPETCDADLDGDGEVKVADLLLLIGAWGVCP